jgi:hypothetical protein
MKGLYRRNKMSNIILQFLLLICFSTMLNAAAPDLKIALSQLNAQTPFVDFNLGLTDGEKQQLEKIILKPSELYDNYGSIKELIVDLTMFFEAMGNDYNSSYAAAKTIHKTVGKIVKDLGAESFWLELDITRPHKERFIQFPFYWRYDESRYSFGNLNGILGNITNKICFTLKGPSMIFYNISLRDREKFNEIFYRESELEYEDIKGAYKKVTIGYGGTEKGRVELDQLIDKSKIHQPQSYTGTVFMVGDKNTAAIYSEPIVYENQIYVSIVPGSKKQIQELHKAHHNKEYIKVISTTYK